MTPQLSTLPSPVQRTVKAAVAAVDEADQDVARATAAAVLEALASELETPIVKMLTASRQEDVEYGRIVYGAAVERIDLVMELRRRVAVIEGHQDLEGHVRDLSQYPG